MLIGVCYRPPNTELDNGNGAELRSLISEVSNRQFVLMGDFNYPGIDWVNYSVSSGATSECCKFLECITDCFVTQHVMEPTRGMAILDLLLTREPNMISSVSVNEPLGSSDHHMVTCVVHQQQDRCSNVVESRDYLKGDYSRIREELANIDWDTMLTGSANECWTRFKEELQHLEELHIPLRKRKGSKRKKPIWMTWRASKLVRRKQRLFAKYRDKDHPSYKSAAKKAKIELRRSRKKFEKQLADNIKKDTKSFYAYVGSRSKAVS